MDDDDNDDDVSDDDDDDNANCMTFRQCSSAETGASVVTWVKGVAV